MFTRIHNKKIQNSTKFFPEESVLLSISYIHRSSQVNTQFSTQAVANESAFIESMDDALVDHELWIKKRLPFLNGDFSFHWRPFEVEEKKNGNR